MSELEMVFEVAQWFWLGVLSWWLWRLTDGLLDLVTYMIEQDNE